jgi:hypothetical protein
MAFPPDVPPLLAAALGLFGVDQSWKDRLREAAYTSPKGTRIKFAYEEVSRETSKRGTAFEFPGVNNGYVQQNGYGSRRYPLRCFFWGKDNDRIATAFESALLEDGLGKLEHPLYGSLKVVPFGDVVRRDNLKEEANQSVVEVTFFTTTGAVYPSSTANGADEIAAALLGFDVAAAQQFSASTDLLGEINKANIKGTIRKFLREVSAAIQSVSDATTSVSREFRDIQRLVNLSMDVLVGQPLLLAQQISNLIKAPGRALAGIESRLDAYAALAKRIFGSAAGRPGDAFSGDSPIPQRRKRIANDFHTSDLFAMNAVAGSVLSVANTTFDTKTQAIAAAAAILTQVDDAVAWRDAGFKALSGIADVGTYQVDTGDAFQAVQHAAALAAGFLIQISFSLANEKRITLDRPRTIIDLSAELYGSVDDRLDFIIQTNDLTGSEILELDRGKRLVYYPQNP